VFLILAYCNTIFKRPSETRFNRLEQNVLFDTCHFSAWNVCLPNLSGKFCRYPTWNARPNSGKQYSLHF